MNSRWLRVIMTVGVAASLTALTVYSQGKGKGKGHDKGEDSDEGKKGGRPQFSPRDREIIAEYYKGAGSNLPPGLAKRGGNLPPGLEKHLERDGTLPPGLQKRIEPCPVELERRLPPLPEDYQRVVIGVHIMILNRQTNVIVDIFKDVAR